MGCRGLQTASLASALYIYLYPLDSSSWSRFSFARQVASSNHLHVWKLLTAELSQHPSVGASEIWVVQAEPAADRLFKHLVSQAPELC